MSELYKVQRCLIIFLQGLSDQRVNKRLCRIFYFAKIQYNAVSLGDCRKQSGYAKRLCLVFVLGEAIHAGLDSDFVFHVNLIFLAPDLRLGICLKIH